MSDWINLNIPVYSYDKKLSEEILKANNLEKPKNDYASFFSKKYKLNKSKIKRIYYDWIITEEEQKIKKEISNYFISYHKKLNSYKQTKKNLLKEAKFITSKYNAPGHLVILHSPKLNKFFYFLIGNRSNGFTSGLKAKDMIAIKVKKVVDDEELSGFLCFE